MQNILATGNTPTAEIQRWVSTQKGELMEDVKDKPSEGLVAAEALNAVYQVLVAEGVAREIIVKAMEAGNTVLHDANAK